MSDDLVRVSAAIFYQVDGNYAHWTVLNLVVMVGGIAARWCSSCNCANICVTNSDAVVAVELTSSSAFGCGYPRCGSHTTTETTSMRTTNSVGTNLPGDHNQGFDGFTSVIQSYGWAVVCTFHYRWLPFF